MRSRWLAHSPITATGLATALFTATCGTPMQPGTTIVLPPPSVTCPVAPAPITTVNGLSTIITYDAPTATGGSTPISVSCIPASGSTFPVGSTAVTCTATDAAHRTASCSFMATVMTQSPRLSVTRILAFGDSITEGEVPEPNEFLSAITLGWRPRYVEQEHSYPADLTTLLAPRYTAQGVSRIDAFTYVRSPYSNDCNPDPPSPATGGIVVVNAGCLGTPAGDVRTLLRFQDKIAAYQPDVVLLQLGANDLDRALPNASIAAGVQGVLTLIAYAKGRGISVMVGTLLPEIAGSLTHGGAPELIVPFNTQLMPVATNAGARVVDLYSDIAHDVTTWISPYDGLHPTVAGYQEIAHVWFAAIQSDFELPPSSMGHSRPTPSNASVRKSGVKR